jgi:hypothetical protein
MRLSALLPFIQGEDGRGENKIKNYLFVLLPPLTPSLDKLGTGS